MDVIIISTKLRLDGFQGLDGSVEGGLVFGGPGAGQVVQIVVDGGAFALVDAGGLADQAQNQGVKADPFLPGQFL